MNFGSRLFSEKKNIITLSSNMQIQVWTNAEKKVNFHLSNLN